MENNQKIESILPEKIRYYRQHQGLTQGQLSELVNVTEHYIAEIENALKFSSMELIKKISIELNVPIYNLMQSDKNIEVSKCSELREILNAKDEKELSAILDVLLALNE